jgi:hypothetical protein
MFRTSFALLALVPALALAQTPASPPPGTTAPGQQRMGGMEMPAMDCGRMLQRRSALPIKLEQLMVAAADAYDAHAQWVGKKDKAAEAEQDLLRKVAKADREIAEKSRNLSNTMAKGRDLGMTPHDTRSPAYARVLEEEAKVIRAQRELAQALMQDADERDQNLQRMRQGAGGN